MSVLVHVEGDGCLSSCDAPLSFMKRGSSLRVSLRSSITSTSGSSGAMSGRSVSEDNPSRSRNSSVVAKVTAPVSGSLPASVINPRANSVRITASTLTPRTALTRARVTGWR